MSLNKFKVDSEYLANINNGERIPVSYPLSKQLRAILALFVFNSV